ncbi:hypothetical protein ACFLTM_02720 [Candidatus Bipolaricaulota bacterium]
MNLKLTGTVYLRRSDGTQVAVPGCTVFHLYKDCCSEQTGPQPRDRDVSAADGSYAIMFSSRSGRYTHTIRCDHAGPIAATRRHLSPNDIRFNRASLEAQNDFVFDEAAQGSVAHPCGGVCSTKDTPCQRNTTKTGHCYQHVDQDVA